MLRVRDCITNDVLQEDLEYPAGLLVDEAGDSLHSAATSESTNGGLGDALNVVTKDLTMTLGASFSETFTSFATTGHTDTAAQTDKTLTEDRSLKFPLCRDVADLNGSLTFIGCDWSIN